MGTKKQYGMNNLVPDPPREGMGNIHNVDISQLVDGHNKFAIDLYHQIRSKPANLFYSPYSIFAALAMVYVGADGNTAREMAEVLHVTLENKRLNPAISDLEQQLSALAEIENVKRKGDPFRLNIANAVWGQKGYHIKKPYLDVLATNYGAGFQLVDFVQQPQESRQTINQWVSDHTEERVQNLIPPNAINSDTRMVLSNAIYFIASWLEPFSEDFTKKETFYGLGGKLFSAQMMHLVTSLRLRYLDGGRFKAVELPYTGGHFSMLILVPDRGYFKRFEKKLTYDQLVQIINGLKSTKVQLGFPRFKIESEVNLAEILAKMGMSSAFSNEADFSGMTGSKDLFISDVFHKALVTVDEKGTEAAAATAVGILLCLSLDEPVALTVDRPFLFLIRERETNSILFLGRVVDIE